MSSLLEKLKAKRLAEEAAAKATETAKAEETVMDSPVAALEVERTPDVVAVKPMSFAEKLAAKRAAEKAASDKPAEQKVESPEATVAPVETKIEQVAVKSKEVDPARIPEDPETAQAFVTIVKRVEQLEHLIDDDLKTSMSELKIALRKNPAATELLLDEEVGLMVSALRRMNNIAMVAAEKPKKAGARTKATAKEVAMTQEELAKAFDEL